MIFLLWLYYQWVLKLLNIHITLLAWLFLIHALGAKFECGNLDWFDMKFEWHKIWFSTLDVLVGIVFQFIIKQIINIQIK